MNVTENEEKHSVICGTRWRSKISLVTYRPRSMRDIRKPGQSLAELHRWNSDQTSAKHRFLSTSIRNGIRRILNPAHRGGSGMTTGGVHKIYQSQVPLSSWSGITEQWDLLKTLTHQATQNGMLIKLGLLNSGNLMKIEQGDLLYSHSTAQRQIHCWKR